MTCSSPYDGLFFVISKDNNKRVGSHAPQAVQTSPRYACMLDGTFCSAGYEIYKTVDVREGCAIRRPMVVVRELDSDLTKLERICDTLGEEILMT